MAYVVPNTTIYLLNNVPLTPDYRDTYYFENEAQQQAYFRSKIAFTFTSQSYQRVNSGTLRVQLNPAQNPYQCNYLMFSNSSHWNNKWFYAFITSIDYINENCAEVSYTIDVIQTWFFQYNEDMCLVKRQSPNVDYIGSNLQPEQFDCGTYVVNIDEVPQDTRDDETGYKGDYMGLLYLDNMQNNDGACVDGVFSACQLYVFQCTTAGITALNNFIDGHISKTVNAETTYYPDNFVGMYMMPHECFAKNDQPSNGELFSGNLDTAEWHYTLTGINNNTSLDGYVPKYKKLLTHPFNFLQVDSGNGQSQTYQYEFFASPSEVIFRADANMIAPCNLTIFPFYYKRSDASYPAEQISTGSFPMCSWSSDAWAAWLGQNSSLPLTEQTSREFATAHYVMENVPSKGQIAKDVFMNPIRTGARIMGKLAGVSDEMIRSSQSASNPIGKSMTGDAKTIGKDIFNGIACTNPSYRASDITKGTVYNGSNWYASRVRKHFHFRRMSVTREYAEKIDKFFDAFGYAVNDIAQPLRRTRKMYTYVQTLGCEIKGNVSAEVQEEIAQIYDGGIRFWNFSQTGDNLGTYNINLNTTL